MALAVRPWLMLVRLVQSKSPMATALSTKNCSVLVQSSAKLTLPRRGFGTLHCGCNASMELQIQRMMRRKHRAKTLELRKRESP